VREEMRHRGYRRDGWDFNDGALVGVLIGELLRGALSRDGFWDRLERQRVPHRDPWGTGSGNGPWSGGPWSDGGWSAPSPGGFDTGGGFGGGGFRTGGTMEGSQGGGFRTGGSF
jgi:hypothetical protein